MMATAAQVAPPATSVRYAAAAPSAPKSSGAECKCARCGSFGCDVRIDPCGCTVHARCMPMTMFADYKDAIVQNRPPRPSDVSPLYCPLCRSGSVVSGLYLFPLSFEDLEQSGALRRRCAAAAAGATAARGPGGEKKQQLAGTVRKRGGDRSYYDDLGDNDDNNNNDDDDPHQIQAVSTPFLGLVHSMAGDHARRGEVDRHHYRTGRWTSEEMTFVDHVIRHFESGLLPVPRGVKLNEVLGDFLMCKSSRLTKKMKNAKLSARSYAFGDWRSGVSYCPGTLSRLQDLFLKSVPTEPVRLELRFNLSRMWRVHFSNLCLQLSYDGLATEDWVSSLEEMESRSVRAEDRVRDAQRRRMGRALTPLPRKQDSMRRGECVDAAAFAVSAPGPSSSSFNGGNINAAAGMTMQAAASPVVTAPPPPQQYQQRRPPAPVVSSSSLCSSFNRGSTASLQQQPQQQPLVVVAPAGPVKSSSSPFSAGPQGGMQGTSASAPAQQQQQQLALGGAAAMAVDDGDFTTDTTNLESANISALVAMGARRASLENLRDALEGGGGSGWMNAAVGPSRSRLQSFDVAAAVAASDNNSNSNGNSATTTAKRQRLFSEDLSVSMGGENDPLAWGGFDYLGALIGGGGGGNNTAVAPPGNNDVGAAAAALACCSMPPSPFFAPVAASSSAGGAAQQQTPGGGASASSNTAFGALLADVFDNNTEESNTTPGGSGTDDATATHAGGSENKNDDDRHCCTSTSTSLPFLNRVADFMERSDLPFQHADVWVPSFAPTNGGSSPQQQQQQAQGGAPAALHLRHAGSITRRDYPSSSPVLSNLVEFGRYSSAFTIPAAASSSDMATRVYTSGVPTWENSVHNAGPHHFIRAEGAARYGVRTAVAVPVGSASVGRIVVALYGVEDVPRDVELVRRCYAEFQGLAGGPEEPNWKLVIENRVRQQQAQAKAQSQAQVQVQAQAQLPQMQGQHAQQFQALQHQLHHQRQQSVQAGTTPTALTSVTHAAAATSRSGFGNNAAAELVSNPSMASLASSSRSAAPPVAPQASSLAAAAPSWRRSDSVISISSALSSTGNTTTTPTASTAAATVAAAASAGTAEEERIATVLGEHMPTTSSSSSAASPQIVSAFISLRLLLLRPPSRRTSKENEAIDIVSRSYRGYAMMSKRSTSDVATLLVRDWIFLSQSLLATAAAAPQPAAAAQQTMAAAATTSAPGPAFAPGPAPASAPAQTPSSPGGTRGDSMTHVHHGATPPAPPSDSDGGATTDNGKGKGDDGTENKQAGGASPSSISPKPNGTALGPGDHAPIRGPRRLPVASYSASGASSSSYSHISEDDGTPSPREQHDGRGGGQRGRQGSSSSSSKQQRQQQPSGASAASTSSAASSSAPPSSIRRRLSVSEDHPTSPPAFTKATLVPNY